MRMWMIDPKLMCQKHLCGEHVETHMFLGALKKGSKLDGYLNGNLFEPRSLKERHDALASEMTRRGYNHKSPLTVDESLLQCLGDACEIKIDREKASSDLFSRCEKCGCENEVNQ